MSDCLANFVPYFGQEMSIFWSLLGEYVSCCATKPLFEQIHCSDATFHHPWYFTIILITLCRWENFKRLRKYFISKLCVLQIWKCLRVSKSESTISFQTCLASHAYFSKLYLIFFVDRNVLVVYVLEGINVSVILFGLCALLLSWLELLWRLFLWRCSVALKRFTTLRKQPLPLLGVPHAFTNWPRKIIVRSKILTLMEGFGEYSTIYFSIQISRRSRLSKYVNYLPQIFRSGKWQKILLTKITQCLLHEHQFIGSVETNLTCSLSLFH